MDLAAARKEGFVSRYLSENVTKPFKKRHLAVVGIITTFGRKQNRDAIRKAWMPTGTLSPSLWVSYFFLRMACVSAMDFNYPFIQIIWHSTKEKCLHGLLVNMFLLWGYVWKFKFCTSKLKMMPFILGFDRLTISFLKLLLDFNFIICKLFLDFCLDWQM